MSHVWLKTHTLTLRCQQEQLCKVTTASYWTVRSLCNSYKTTFWIFHLRPISFKVRALCAKDNIFLMRAGFSFWLQGCMGAWQGHHEDWNPFKVVFHSRSFQAHCSSACLSDHTVLHGKDPNSWRLFWSSSASLQTASEEELASRDSEMTSPSANRPMR